MGLKVMKGLSKEIYLSNLSKKRGKKIAISFELIMCSIDDDVSSYAVTLGVQVFVYIVACKSY